LFRKKKTRERTRPTFDKIIVLRDRLKDGMKVDVPFPTSDGVTSAQLVVQSGKIVGAGVSSMDGCAVLFFEQVGGRGASMVVDRGGGKRLMAIDRGDGSASGGGGLHVSREVEGRRMRG
jgi:hypothetical protein